MHVKREVYKLLLCFFISCLASSMRSDHIFLRQSRQFAHTYLQNRMTEEALKKSDADGCMTIACGIVDLNKIGKRQIQPYNDFIVARNLEEVPRANSLEKLLTNEYRQPFYRYLFRKPRERVEKQW